MSRPSVGSLCSGYGGLDLAAAAHYGADVAWHAEYDDAPARVLDHHWPDVPNLRDITATDWATVPPVDILTAGYPCQPFSMAGHRRGKHDERHLWPYVADAIGVLRPRHVVLENVAGHTSLGGLAVVGDLADLGYDARWAVIRASDVGAPHSRARLFIVATDAKDHRRGRGDAGGRPTPLPRPTGGHVPVADTRGRSLTGTRPTGHGLPVAPERGAGAPADPDRVGVLGRAQTGRDTVRANIGDDADGRDRPWGPYAPAVERWEGVIGRPAPTPTIRGGPRGVRLNPRLPEWMMGLPDGWVTDVPGLSIAKQLKVLGNGVVPQQAAYALGVLDG